MVVLAPQKILKTTFYDCCLYFKSFHNLIRGRGGIVLFIYTITIPYLLGVFRICHEKKRTSKKNERISVLAERC